MAQSQSKIVSVRRRQSPGGVITCNICGDIVSRRRYNNALRFAQTPNCRGGHTSLTIDGSYEIRGRRLIWARVRPVRKEVR